MATNSFQNTNLILTEFLAHFQNHTQFALTASRDFTEDYKNKPMRKGDTLQYRLPYQFTAGHTLSITPQNTVDRVRSIVVDTLSNIALEFNGTQITLEDALKDPFKKEYMLSQIETIANDVELNIGSAFYQSVYNCVGTPGAAVTDTVVQSARTLGVKLGIPMNMRTYGALSADASGSLANTVANFFNTKVNTASLEKGYLGSMKGIEFFETVHLPYHTSGIGAGGGITSGKIGAGTVNGAVSTGSTIVAAGLGTATGVFKAGDVIEIEGTYSVNPLTKASTGKLMTFTVTADVDSTGGAATIPVSPAIITTGAGQNVSGALANGAPISLYASHQPSIVYNKAALYYAAPQLTPLTAGVISKMVYDDKFRMALTYTQGSNITDYLHIERLDHLYGKAFNPEFAIRVMS